MKTIFPTSIANFTRYRVLIPAALAAIAVSGGGSSPVYGQDAKRNDQKLAAEVRFTPVGRQAKTTTREEVAARSRRHPKLSAKIEARLLDAWEKIPTEGAAGARNILKQKSVTFAESGQDVVVVVTLEAGVKLSDIEARLGNIGAVTVRSEPNSLKVAAPVAQLAEIASIPGVSNVRSVRPPKLKNATRTEGVSATLANSWHSAGYTGQGVKVAIVDGGFANLANLKAQDEIPAGATEVNYTGTSMTAGTVNHGTACAEIVYDIAPAVQMYLIKIDDPTDLIAVKDYCVSNGITVVSSSLGYDALNFYDGVAYNNWFTTVANHPVTAVDAAYSNGIVWVNAAGNEQEQQSVVSWQDGDSDDYLDWTSNNGNLNVLWLNGSTTIPAGTDLDLITTWNQWPICNQDFDLKLYKDTGSGWRLVETGFITGYSGDDTQDGSATSYPYEEILYTTPATGRYAVVIEKYSATTSPTFILRCYGVDFPNYFGYDNTSTPPPGSISIPGDAASAFTVGAINQDTYAMGPIEYFSSLGPNNRAYTGGSAVTKPDICGPDQVSTISYGGTGFGGTSSATPHIAGLAALVKGAYPSYTAAQIRNYIETNGVDLGAAGKDNTYGAGPARLPAPPPIPQPEIAVGQPAGTNIADGGTKDYGSVGVGLNNSLTFTVRNIGNANLTISTPTVNGTNASEFTVTTNPAATVTASGSTTFVVRFAPTGTGTRTAVLHITNNDSNESPFDITLTGTGTAPEIAVEQPAGTNIADGGTKDYGSVGVGSNNSLTFTVRNIGNANLTISTPTVNGTNASEFTVTTNPAATVTASGSTTFVVRFAPTGTGTRTAVLHITNNDSNESPFDITLTGIGVGTPVQSWRLIHFGSAENSGDGAALNDFDKDGVPNLLEYAFGGNPRVTDTSNTCPMPNVSSGKLQIRFKCDAARTDISYTVQASQSLNSGTWTDIARSIGGATAVPIGTLSKVTDTGTGQRNATVTAAAEVFPAGRGFLRIKISE